MSTLAGGAAAPSPRSGGASRHGRPHRRPLRWTERVIVTGLMIVLAVLIALHEWGFRGWEAFTAGHLTALVTAAPAYIHQTTFYVDLGRPDIFGLRVTGECTAALIIIGLLGITAALTVLTRLPLHRLVAATVVASTVFYAINQVRLLAIALATRQWGLGPGYHWSHVWAGTFITVIGAAGVLAIYLSVLGAVRRHARPGNRT